MTLSRATLTGYALVLTTMEIEDATLKTVAYLQEWKKTNHGTSKYKHRFTLDHDIVVCFNLIGYNKLDGIWIDLNRGFNGKIKDIDDTTGTSNYTLSIFNTNLILPSFNINYLPSKSKRSVSGYHIGIGTSDVFQSRILHVYTYDGFSNKIQVLRSDEKIGFGGGVTYFVSKKENTVFVSSAEGQIVKEITVDQTYILTMVDVDGKFSWVGKNQLSQLTVNGKPVPDIFFSTDVNYFYDITKSLDYYFTSLTGIIWKYNSTQKQWTRIYTYATTEKNFSPLLQYINGDIFLFASEYILRLKVMPTFAVCDYHENTTYENVPLLKKLREDKNYHDLNITCDGGKIVTACKVIVFASDVIRSIMNGFSEQVVNSLLDYAIYDNLSKIYTFDEYLIMIQIAKSMLALGFKSICLLGLKKFLTNKVYKFPMIDLNKILSLDEPQATEIWLNAYFNYSSTTEENIYDTMIGVWGNHERKHLDD